MKALPTINVLRSPLPWIAALAVSVLPSMSCSRDPVDHRYPEDLAGDAEDRVEADPNEADRELDQPLDEEEDQPEEWVPDPVQEPFDTAEQQPDGPPDPLAVGTAHTFEVATWNLHNFPSTSSSVNRLAELIGRLEIDLIAVQEIASVDAFEQVIDRLAGWEGVLSEDEYSSSEYQKTGLIYRAREVEVSGAVSILEGDSYAFPRPPLQADVIWTAGDGRQLSFVIIVVHLKASAGYEQEARRRDACEKLDRHIDSLLSLQGEDQVFVVGDFNDELADPPSDNVFQVFLEDPDHYRFLTESVSENEEYSYIPYQRLLDHILVTTSLDQVYQGGFTDILELDVALDAYDYQEVISDHRPVAAVFPVE